jgi:hypothetical protein
MIASAERETTVQAIRFGGRCDPDVELARLDYRPAITPEKLEMRAVQSKAHPLRFSGQQGDLLEILDLANCPRHRLKRQWKTDIGLCATAMAVA